MALASSHSSIGTADSCKSLGVQCPMGGSWGTGTSHSVPLQYPNLIHTSPEGEEVCPAVSLSLGWWWQVTALLPPISLHFLAEPAHPGCDGDRCGSQ